MTAVTKLPTPALYINAHGFTADVYDKPGSSRTSSRVLAREGEKALLTVRRGR